MLFMTEIVGYFIESDYIKDEEKSKIKLGFKTVIEELDLVYKLKKIDVTYNIDDNVINENCRARIIRDVTELKKGNATFETLKKYLLINDKVHIELIRTQRISVVWMKQQVLSTSQQHRIVTYLYHRVFQDLTESRNPLHYTVNFHGQKNREKITVSPERRNR